MRDGYNYYIELKGINRNPNISDIPNATKQCLDLIDRIIGTNDISIEQYEYIKREILIRFNAVKNKIKKDTSESWYVSRFNSSLKAAQDYFQKIYEPHQDGV